MLLPQKTSDREVLKRLRRLAFRIDSGIIPSVEMHKSRIRIKGKGERIGFHDIGRLQDYHIMQSAIRDQPVFRNNFATRLRRVLLLTDFHTLDQTSVASRLVEMATLVGGMLLSSPETVTTLSVFGLEKRVIPSEMNSVGQYAFLKKTMNQLSKVPVDSYPSAGKLRLATLLDPDAFVVFVSHYLNPRWLEGISFPCGGCLFLVTPSSGGLINRLGGASGANPFEPRSEQEESIQLKYERLQKVLKIKQIRTIPIAGKGPALEALEKSLEKQKTSKR